MKVHFSHTQYCTYGHSHTHSVVSFSSLRAYRMSPFFLLYLSRVCVHMSHT